MKLKLEADYGFELAVGEDRPGDRFAVDGGEGGGVKGAVADVLVQV